MGSAVTTIQKNLFEQASLFRHRKTHLNERQKQTNTLLKLYFFSTLGIILTQLAISQQENTIFQLYVEYRKKLDQERRRVKESM